MSDFGNAFSPAARPLKLQFFSGDGQDASDNTQSSANAQSAASEQSISSDGQSAILDTVQTGAAPDDASPRKEVRQDMPPEETASDAPQTASDPAQEALTQDLSQSDREAQARFCAKAAALARSIAQTAQIYPAFDLAREMRTPRFLRLIDAGLSVREAYETLHRDELLAIAVQSAAHAARQNAARLAAQRRDRPEENGAAVAVVTRRDPGAMSRAQREEISRRVLRGEKVTF